MFRDANFRRLLLARFVSRVGGIAAFFVGIWGRAAYELNASPADLAVLMAVFGIAEIVGATVGGVLVDRHGPRRVLLAAEVLFAPAALALILPDTVGQLAAVVALAALLGAVVYTAVASFPPFLTDDATELARLNAALEGAGTLAFVVGPAVGAVIAPFGLSWIFALDAATSVVAVVFVTGLTLRAAGAVGQRQALREVREGLAYAYRAPTVRFVLLVGALTWLSFGVFGALEPLFHRDVLGVGPAALGWVNTVFGVGLALGAVLLERLPRLVSKRSVALLGVTSGCGAFAYAATADLRIVVAGVGAWGFVLGLMLPAMRTLVQRATPEGLQGRAMGVFATHESAAQMLPLVFVPGLAAVFGVQEVLVASGVVVAFGSLIALPVARRGGAVPAPPSPGRLDPTTDLEVVA